MPAFIFPDITRTVNASITPLQLDLTHQKMMDELKKLKF